MPYRLNASRLINAVNGSKFTPPRGGWNRESFVREGHALIVTMARVAKITQRKAAPEIAAGMLRVVRFQMEEVRRRVFHRLGRSAATGRQFKAEIEVSLPGHEALWAAAIEEVFAETGGKITAVLAPPIQSVIAQGYSRTSILLGREVDADVNAGIARRAQDAARDLAGLDKGTSDLMRRVVAQSIAQGDTVAETAAALEERVEQITKGRSLTVARTETMNAWTEGSIQTYKESPTLTHCSVIGCESRETERWGQPSYQEFMYRGESTCNIVDVQVADLDQLNFHPNHSGVLVPSRFID